MCLCSTVPATSNGLVGVLKTFRVPDKGNKGVWSLVCANAFPALFFLPILGGKDFLVVYLQLEYRKAKAER